MLGLVLFVALSGNAVDRGSYQHALSVADACETPTAWVEVDRRDGAPFYFAVCGTADGRVCGQDVPWTHYDCQEHDHSTACDQF